MFGHWNLLFSLSLPNGSNTGTNEVNLLHYCYTAASGRALDDAHGLFNIIGIQVGHLGLRDLADFFPTQLSHAFLFRIAGALGQPRRLQDKIYFAD